MSLIGFVFLSLVTSPADAGVPVQSQSSPGCGMDWPDAGALGTLDKKEIRRVIHAHRTEVRACFEKTLQSADLLAGKLAIRFVVGLDGAVCQAQTTGNSFGSDALADCVVNALRKWRFAPPGGGPVIVTYPIVF
jgi:TonB family protein